MKDCKVKYFGMAIAHGGKLPRFYEMRWKDFALGEKVKKLGIPPEEKLGDTLRKLKLYAKTYKQNKKGGINEMP